MSEQTNNTKITLPENMLKSLKDSLSALSTAKDQISQLEKMGVNVSELSNQTQVLSDMANKIITTFGNNNQ